MTAPAWVERVHGTERTGALLSLDEEHAPLRRSLMEAAKDLYLKGQHRRNPDVGDLVVVVDVLFPMGRPHDDWWRGFGVLIAREPDAWFIQYGNDPEDIARWTNAQPIGVPT